MGETSLFKKFFPIVDTCLSGEDIARESCAMVTRWRLFAIVCVLHFERAACSTFQTLHFKLALGHTMCGSMADIQSAAVRLGEEKKEERKKKELECGPMPNLMVALPNIGGALYSTPQSLADAHY